MEGNGDVLDSQNEWGVAYIPETRNRTLLKGIENEGAGEEVVLLLSLVLDAWMMDRWMPQSSRAEIALRRGCDVKG